MKTPKFTRFTPAPWTANVFHDGRLIAIEARESYATVAVCQSDMSEEARAANRADASLISAAPDLLQAARLAFQGFCNRIPDPAKEPASYLEWEALRDAIAKAEGQS